MADAAGSTTHSVIEEIRARPERFDFLQAVRRIESAAPDRPCVGQSVRPDQDTVRFAQEPSLSYAPSTIKRMESGRAGAPPRMLVHFLGLLGPNGPLPLHLTEYARERIKHVHDHTFARFLDTFNHRMLALFYDAWARNHQAVSFGRGKDNDRIATYIASMFGLGMESLLDRDAVQDMAKLYFSGQLVCKTRHPEGLCAILRTYFRLDASIQEFMGQWITLPHKFRCRVGESPNTGLLGRTIVVGSRVWDCQQRFRIRLGPMTFREYERMLPGGTSLQRLIDWIRNYTGESLAWEAQLVLKKEEVPDTQLGKQGRMGWSMWLKSKPFDHDADDLVLRPCETASEDEQ